MESQWLDQEVHTMYINHKLNRSLKILKRLFHWSNLHIFHTVVIIKAFWVVTLLAMAYNERHCFEGKNEG